MTRLLPLLALCSLGLASCGVFGLGSEKKQQLTLHQSNAQLYVDGRQYSQALDQVRRGLEIDPDDYKLNMIRSFCLLSLAQETNDADRLRQASEAFDKLLTLRASDKLEPKAHLGYALVQQRLGMQQRSEADRMNDELKRSNLSDLEKSSRENKATEHQRKAESHMQTAERELQGLAASGDLPLLAHYHLLQIYALQNRHREAIVEGTKYIELATKQQEAHRQQIEKTSSVGYEKDQRGQLQDLIDKEIEVRALLAHLHWKLGEHDLSVAQLDRVLTLDPARSVDYYNRGRSYQALNRPEEMRRDYKKFLATTKLPPGSAQVTEAYAALRNP